MVENVIVPIGINPTPYWGMKKTAPYYYETKYKLTEHNESDSRLIDIDIFNELKMEVDKIIQ